MLKMSLWPRVNLNSKNLHPSSYNAAVTAKKRAIHFCFTLALTNLVAYQELLIFLWALAKIGKLMGKVSKGTLAVKPFSKEKDMWGSGFTPGVD